MRRIKKSEMAEVKKKLLRKQRGKCPLCKCELDDPADRCLDHDHKTGYIRALLCRNCNAMEGKVFNCSNRAKRDGTPLEWGTRVLDYWRTHAECQTGLLHPDHKTPDEKRISRNKKAAKARKRKKGL